jgi:hypothetical protein
VRLTKHLLGFLAVCVSSPLTSGQPRQPAPGKFPVKRVVLFKNGVGYFEHIGAVHGNESVSIGFTSGQLNDVLKSLTVLDLNGGRITGVAYGTATPLDRQLVDLRLPLGEKTTLADFLSALRGTRLEVKSGQSAVTGRLLSIERKTRISGGTTLEVDYLSLISDSGELRTTEISPSFSVRLLETGLPRRVDRFLDIMSAGREADMRQMVVTTAGVGDRSIYVSYISEVPGLEIDLPHRPEFDLGEKSFAAGMGNYRQHCGRGLEQCRAVSSGRCTPILHTRSFQTLLLT